MRMTVLAGLVFGLVIVQTDHGHAQPSPPYSGTPSELADDALGGALWRIAVATQTRIGFESVEFVQVPVRINRVPVPAPTCGTQTKAATTRRDWW